MRKSCFLAGLIFALCGNLWAQSPEARAAEAMSAARKLRAEDKAESLEKAQRSFQEAAGLWHDLHNQKEEAAALAGVADVYIDLGNSRSAIEYLNRSLELAKAAGDLEAQAKALSNLGGSHAELAEPAEALESLDEALRIQRSIKNRRGESIALNTLGFVYSMTGNPQQALNHYLLSLPIRRELGDKRGEANVLGNIGAAYKTLGEDELALEYQEKALAIKQEIKDRRSMALTLANIGEIHTDAGDNASALKVEQQALDIFREIGDRRSEAGILHSLGRTYSAIGRHTEAAGYFEQALQLNRKVNDRRGEGLTLTSFAAELSAQGQTAKAVELASQAASLLHESRDPLHETDAVYIKARCEFRLGRIEQALGEIDSAIAMSESIRNTVVGHDARTFYFSGNRRLYDLKVTLLMLLHREVEAFNVSERARARSLLDILPESRLDIHSGVDPLLLNRERTLRASLNAGAARQMRLLSGSYTPEQAAAEEKRLAGLTTQYQELEAEIRASSPRYAELRSPEPLNLSEIRKTVLTGGNLLLEYFLGEDASYLFEVDPANFHVYPLPPRAELEATARAAYADLSSAGKTANTSSAKLAQMLLGPVALRLQSKRLLLVTEGALQLIPFAALPVAGEPLVARHEIASAPSASIAAMLRKQFANRKPAPEMVAAFGDPVFSRSDPRLKDPVASERSAGYERLPSTRKEVEEIAALAPKAHWTALDFDATRAAALRPGLAQYRIVHFASHGLLNSKQPELSGIVLSMVNRDGKSENGILQTTDIYNMKLNADLVVLSACRTALGKDVRGEGLIGLTRAFFYAGSPRVIASMWRVPDVATRELMKHFYSAMLTGGMSPAAALRTAQVKMRNDPRWSAPYYWAAFTLQGEWR